MPERSCSGKTNHAHGKQKHREAIPPSFSSSTYIPSFSSFPIPFISIKIDRLTHKEGEKRHRIVKLLDKEDNMKLLMPSFGFDLLLFNDNVKFSVSFWKDLELVED